jgi:uncharacterized protein YkwD
MTFLKAALVCACLLSLTLVVPADASAASGYGCRDAHKRPGAVKRDRLIGAVRCVINAERRARGLNAVAPAPTLRRAAAGHASSMARNDFFSHTSLDGRSLVDRVVAASEPGQWAWVGEVLGWGCGRAGSPASMVASWLASPTHRAVLHSPRPTHLGVTYAAGTPVAQCKSGATWTAEFGLAR